MTTNKDQLHHLKRRIHRLETALSGLILFCVCISLTAATRDTVEQSVRTRKLEIVDGHGRVAVLVGTSDEGDGFIDIRTTAGASTFIGMGFIETSNDSGGTAISIGTDDLGNGYYEAYSKSGNSYFYAGPTQEGDALVEIGTAEGIPVATMAANGAHNGQLKLFSRTGSELLTATADADHNGFLQVHSRVGRGMVIVGIDSIGSGVVGLIDRRGTATRQVRPE